MRILLALVMLLGVAPSVSAHEDHAPILEELVVYGRSEQSIGVTQAASEGLVGYADIRLPPLLRVGELVEVVPGMVATQHSGTGKANQYFLRGFNLDHGTDFSASADGVPLNMRTHGHGQGYLDLNFLIPELVATTHYRKGPYSAETGDFSSAGSVEFSFYERLPENLVALTYGENAYRRGLAAGSAQLGEVELTSALDVTRYDGPWRLDENLEQLKGYLSLAFDLAGGRARISLQGYDGQWDATDQIPLRAVRSGLISELGFVDPDLGGDTHRYALTAALEFAAWRATAYVIDYDFTLFSDFTYLLEDPLAGDEFEQRDARTIYGASVAGALDRPLGASQLTLRWGGDLRFDDIDRVGLYATAARQRLNLIRDDSVGEFSASAYSEAELAVTQRLRGFVGLRADLYDWDVDAFRDVNSGSGNDSLVTPKLGAAYRFGDGLEAYLNWGRGFHSNDVRGSTIRVDPVSGDPAERVDALVKSEGAELGLRMERGRRFNATLVGFWLDLDSELVFVGDGGSTEPNDASERRGVEFSTFWQATDWLALNAAYTYTHAQFKRDQGGGREIPGAVQSTFTLGLNAVWDNGFSASARLRYLGEAPLIEDGSVTADDSMLVNAGVAYRRGRVETRLDVFNLLDSNDHDISYFYASRLDGEPAQGVEDIHFHPLEPRTVRASVALKF
ncbi:MAG: TonB-dependent receptor [Pseudomonadales bacterium]